MKEEIKKYLKVLASENEELPKAVKTAALAIYHSEKKHEAVIQEQFERLATLLCYEDKGDSLRELWQANACRIESEDEAIQEMVKNIAFDIWEIRKVKAEQELEELKKT